jgi:hypothetical protein
MERYVHTTKMVQVSPAKAVVCGYTLESNGHVHFGVAAVWRTELLKAVVTLRTEIMMHEAGRDPVEGTSTAIWSLVPRLGALRGKVPPGCSLTNCKRR